MSKEKLKMVAEQLARFRCRKVMIAETGQIGVNTNNTVLVEWALNEYKMLNEEITALQASIL